MTTPVIQEAALGEKEFCLISDLVYEHCGINLHDGKKELVRARLAKRLPRNQLRHRCAPRRPRPGRIARQPPVCRRS